MPSIVHPNPFTPIDPDVGTGTQNASHDDQRPDISVYVPETQPPETGVAEQATTRDELDIESSVGSTRDDAAMSPPRMAGRVHELELTPSAANARAERSAELGQANEARWRSKSGREDAAPPADQPAMGAPQARSTKQRVPSDYNTGVAGAPRFVSSLALYNNNIGQANAQPIAGPTSLPSRPIGAPRTQAGLKKSAPEFIQAAVADGEAILASKKFIKSESLNDYLRREPVYPRFGPRPVVQDGSPTRASSSASMYEDSTARPAYPFAQPQPQHSQYAEAGPSRLDGAGDDQDRMSVSDHGDPADDPRDPSPLREMLVPRASGIHVQNVPMTEKILATARAIAAELGYATVPVNALGAPLPIDGMGKNAHLAGLPEDTIEYFANMEGENFVVELWSINGRRAYLYSIDDQIDYLHHVFDRLTLDQFPDNRIKFSHLFSPNAPSTKNAPRVRASLFMAHGGHVRQKAIFCSARFWTAAGANFIVYDVDEARSTYVTSFGGIRCDARKEMEPIVKLTIKKAQPLRDMIANRMDERDPAVIADILDHIAEHCVRIEPRQVRPAGQARDITQWSIFADVSGVIADEDRAAFESAMKRVVFSHPEHGLSTYLVWECRICHAISHEDAACDAHTHLKWPLLREPTNGARGPAQHANGGRRDFPPARR